MLPANDGGRESGQPARKYPSDTLSGGLSGDRGFLLGHVEIEAEEERASREEDLDFALAVALLIADSQVERQAVNPRRRRPVGVRRCGEGGLERGLASDVALDEARGTRGNRVHDFIDRFCSVCRICVHNGFRAEVLRLAADDGYLPARDSECLAWKRGPAKVKGHLASDLVSTLVQADIKPRWNVGRSQHDLHQDGLQRRRRCRIGYGSSRLCVRPQAAPG